MVCPIIKQALPIYRAIQAYQPANAQEACDKERMLTLLQTDGDRLLTRDQDTAHFTSSAFVIDTSFDHCLMVYHNIYDSWSWSGGHLDGEIDPMATAIREAWEETGIQNLKPLSSDPIGLDILPVIGHLRKGQYVGAHLHLSLAYGFIGDRTAVLRVCPEENQKVGWIPISNLNDYCTEAHMLPVYQKLIKAFKKLSDKAFL